MVKWARIFGMHGGGSVSSKQSRYCFNVVSFLVLFIFILFLSLVSQWSATIVSLRVSNQMPHYILKRSLVCACYYKMILLICSLFSQLIDYASSFGMAVNHVSSFHHDCKILCGSPICYLSCDAFYFFVGDVLKEKSLNNRI